MAGYGLMRDASQLLAGGALLCAFLLLPPRRPRRAIVALAAQGLLLGAAAALQAWLRWEAGLFGVAVLALTCSGIGLQVVLRQMIEPRHPVVTPSSAASLAAGLGMMIAAVLVIYPVLPADGGNLGLTPVGQGVGVAACTLLLGLLLVALRRDMHGQLLGLCCAGNGALLAVVMVPGLPLPILPALGIAAMGSMAGGLLLARRKFDLSSRLDSAGLAVSGIPGPGSVLRGSVAPDPTTAVRPRPRFRGLARPWTRPS